MNVSTIQWCDVACAHQRIIRMGGAVDDEMANLIVAQLLYLDAMSSTKDITMYVNSPGGSVTAGMDHLALKSSAHLQHLVKWYPRQQVAFYGQFPVISVTTDTLYSSALASIYRQCFCFRIKFSCFNFDLGKLLVPAKWLSYHYHRRNLPLPKWELTCCFLGDNWFTIWFPDQESCWGSRYSIVCSAGPKKKL